MYTHTCVYTHDISLSLSLSLSLPLSLADGRPLQPLLHYVIIIIIIIDRVQLYIIIIVHDTYYSISLITSHTITYDHCH